MTDTRLKELFIRALNNLLLKDTWLLQNNLHERCITHKLAEYIQQRFHDYDVDCGYNGDIEREGLRKRINVQYPDMQERGERSVYPDVIIHERGSNESNLCIIEVKKTTSNEDQDFDREKLMSYTSDEDGNNLGYQLGVFVVLETGVEEPTYEIEYFKSGSVFEF